MLEIVLAHFQPVNDPMNCIYAKDKWVKYAESAIFLLLKSIPTQMRLRKCKFRLSDELL